MKNFKLRASISDADILINFFSVKQLDKLESLFLEIVAPHYILEKELSNKSPGGYKEVKQRIDTDNSVFIYKNRRKNTALRIASQPVIDDLNLIIGPGEAECAGYATALEIPIIISDNVREFMYLEDGFIMLCHTEILSLLVYYEVVTIEEATMVYKKIQAMKSQPSSHTFKEKYDRAMKLFKTKEWEEYLGLD